MPAHRSRPDFSLEEKLIGEGYVCIAGVDEAGRGPWAGPVVAAAVVLSARDIPPGLDDSKKLSGGERERLFGQLCNCAQVGIGIIDSGRIDAINILNATFEAMLEAMRNLPAAPDFALVDGNRSPEASCPLASVVKGDSRSLSIAAASIVAKVTRDRMMVAMAEEFPDYGFERHKGYGTRQHRDALARFGPCRHHRQSFAPIKKLLEMDSLGGR